MAEDYVMTIDSDADDVPLADKHGTDDALMNPNFTFDLSGDLYANIINQNNERIDQVKVISTPAFISVDDIIARRRLSLKRTHMGDGPTDGDDSRDNDSTTDNEADGCHDFNTAGTSNSDTSEGEDGDVNISDDEDLDESSSDEDESETRLANDRKAAFFDPDIAPSDDHTSFLTMNLSRPILKAISALGYQRPTPIQSATIPAVLLGKDVVGNAITGSGKTAAFIIPMLERLLYRERGQRAAATRCLILVPTRELAMQCYDVGTKLASRTDVTFCLVIGGLSIKSQETALRNRPDVVIATPGRLIDHIHNSPSFTLDALDILVLDEADRMLSDGFTDELTEIVKSCPTSRQTLLFSATMTDSVDELVKLSLNKPVRLFVDPNRCTARGLVQEFVRVRTEKEDERPALLIALCKRTFKGNAIIFLRSKRLAHQMRVTFSLLGMKCEELHGNLSQEQRLRALQLFREGSVDFLMATDLAARGLDIKGIETVINYDMPSQLAQYLHRVGRTARAGQKGRSITLVGEADRRMLKTVIRHSSGEGQVRHRIIPAGAAIKWVNRLKELKDEISEILQEEKEEHQLLKAEMEIEKGQNMVRHEAEIYSRPARTWFQSSKDKLKAAVISKQQHEAKDGLRKASKVSDGPKRDQYSGLSRKAKRRKIEMEEEVHGNRKVLDAAIRSAKKVARPKKIGMAESQPFKALSRQRNTVRKKVVSRAGDTFDRNLRPRFGNMEGDGFKNGRTASTKNGGKRTGHK